MFAIALTVEEVPPVKVMPAARMKAMGVPYGVTGPSLGDILTKTVPKDDKARQLIFFILVLPSALLPLGTALNKRSYLFFNF